MRATLYCHAVTDKPDDLWGFSQNCFGEIAVLQWCHVFNSYSDCTHFTKLFDDPTISALGDPFTSDAVRSRLYSAGGFQGGDDYAQFRQSMVAFRNTCAAHWDYNEVATFPDLDKALAVAVEMRNGLKVLVEKTPESDRSAKHRTLADLLTSYDGTQQLKFFNLEADHLKSLK